MFWRSKTRPVCATEPAHGLDPWGDKTGLYLHPTIAVDAGDGALLGLLTADFLVHDDRPKAHRHQRRLADKESRRWVDAIYQAEDLLTAGAAQVTMIADREADIYDCFVRRPAGVDVLVRVHHNRVLADGTFLYDRCAPLRALGQVTANLPAAPGRKARTVTLALRACQVEVKRPKRNRASEAAEMPVSVTLSLVEALEVDPPSGERPLLWRLLSTHTVATLTDPVRMVGFYRQRWTIEQVFRTMKTQGFDIEAVPIRENAPLRNLACATLIAAITVQQMLHDRDVIAGRPMEDVFDPDEHGIVETIGKTLEGKTQRQKNPHPPGTLARAAWICARLGGWTGYYGKPGPIVHLRGFMKLQTMIEGIKRFALV